jgi:hypothetical protein
MPITYPEAKLSAFYKGADNALHRLDAWIGIDPEGVTEEDVQRLSHETYIHLSCEDIEFVEPVLVLIRGSKQ